MILNTANRLPWTGMLPVEDTALAVTDRGGAGRPVVYLNGSYASQRHWRPVIAELGSGWRHVTYDERARGKSKRSADYSFEACLRDIDAVLEATGVDKPILAGWSYGATLAVYWAYRNPGRVAGIVSVDGAFPYAYVDDEFRERARKLFRRMRLFLPLASRMGLAARMSADKHADINIEIGEYNGAIRPLLERATFPIRFVVGTAGHTGGGDDEMERIRASLEPLLVANPNIRVTAKVPSNHEALLRKEYRAVAQAISETAAESERQETL